MDARQFYIPPSQEIFDAIQAAAIRVWSQYDDTYGYASGKIDRVKRIKNVRDNAWYIVAMFDPRNQLLLQHELHKAKAIDAYNAVREVLDWYNQERKRLNSDPTYGGK